MSFWSGETLAVRLPALIEPFHRKRIDCAAYTLRVGPEVYVSPSSTDDAKAKTKTQLAEGQAFSIPAGQFAFLLTEERIHVPADAIAFISIKARVKFRGLVNVSGFHVDPGYRGRLIFSVFNAGPAPVHLSRGDDCFLIWYSSLDKLSQVTKHGTGFDFIPSDLINPIAGEIQSFAGLLEKIRSTEQRLDTRMHAIDKEQATIKFVIGPLFAASLTLSIALGTRACQAVIPAPQPTPVTAPSPRGGMSDLVPPLHVPAVADPASPSAQHPDNRTQQQSAK